MRGTCRNERTFGTVAHLALPALVLLMLSGCGGGGSDNFSSGGNHDPAATGSSSVTTAVEITSDTSVETTSYDTVDLGNDTAVSRENLLSSAVRRTTAPAPAAPFPVMVDQQGVFMSAVKADGGSFYACYNQTGSPYLMFAKSDDNGISWSYSTIDYGGIYASLTIEGNSIYVGYVDQSWKTLKFARSDDRGTSWSITEVDTTLKSDPATRPDNTDPTTPATPDDFKYTAIVRTGTSFFMAYQDRAHKALKLARSLDNGATWSCMTMDASDDNDGDSPSMAVAGTNIYLSYNGVKGTGLAAKDNVYMMVSRDSGATWTKRLVAAASFASGYYTSVAASGAQVYVSYFNALDRTLKFAKSTSNGTKWVIKTVDKSSNVGRYSSLSLSQGTLFLSYNDGTNNSLKVAKSTNGGARWTTRAVVSDAGLSCPAVSSAVGLDFYMLYFNYNPNTPGTTGAMLTKTS